MIKTEKNDEIVIEEEVETKVEEPEEKYVVEELKSIQREAKVHNLTMKDFDLFETALEIRYTSLQLHKFPVEFSTINRDDRKIVKSFGVTNLKLKNWNIKKCETKILEIKNKKFLEVKTKEFILGFEINLKDDGSFTIINNNYYYRIKENDSIIRYLEIVKMFKTLFIGESFEIKGKLMEGSLSFENRIEVMKFELLEKELSELDKKSVSKILMTRNTMYSIALLNLAKDDGEIDSWVNMKKKGYEDLIPGDKIVVERVHELNGVGYNLKEKIIPLDSIVEKELINHDFTAYRRKCKITLEKISKK